MNPKTLKYILKRVLLAIFTIWVVITLTFFIMHAVPGGPFVGEKAVTPQVQKAMEAKYGLTSTMYVIFGSALRSNKEDEWSLTSLETALRPLPSWA